MVIDQGTLLDRIDFNVEQATVHLQDAVYELDEVHTQDSGMFSYWKAQGVHVFCRMTKARYNVLFCFVY